MDFQYSIVLTSFFLTLLYSLIRIYRRNVYSYWERHKIPFAEPTFPFGHLNMWRRRDEHLDKILEPLYHQYKSDSPVVGLYFFLEPMLLITDLDLVQNILIGDFQYFQRRSNIFDKKSDPLSANLFNIDYEDWKPLRSKFNRELTVKKLKLMFPTILSVADEFTERLVESVQMNDTNEMDISDWMTRYAMDVMDASVLGFNRRTLTNPDEKLLSIGKKVFDRPRNTPYRSAVITQFEFFTKIFGFRIHHRDVSDYFIQTVKNTVAARENNNVLHNDLMDTLVKLKNSGNSSVQLTVEEISAHAYVFFLAGFQGSSSVLMYCLHELSMEENKHIQLKARKEIAAILERHCGNLSYKSINEMTYIEQIILGTGLN